MVNKINELVSGKPDSMMVLVTQVTEKKTAAGKPYIEAVLADRKDAEGNVEKVSAKMWNTNAAMFWPQEGDVIEAVILAKPYNGQIGYELVSYNTEVEHTMDKSQFLQAAPMEPETMCKNILSMVHQRANGPLVRILDAIYDKYRPTILRQGAAKVNHHNYLGGLLYHTMRMVGAASMMLRVYPKLDTELLLVGAALHDIGKVVELDTNPMGESVYTPQGVLFGHLMLGAEMVQECAKDLNLAQLESVSLLKHLIISHHGLQEWGAISVPAIPEAMVLHELDMIDSRMDAFEREGQKVGEGTLSDKVFMLGTPIYKPHSNNE